MKNKYKTECLAIKVKEGEISKQLNWATYYKRITIFRLTCRRKLKKRFKF